MIKNSTTPRYFIPKERIVFCCEYDGTSFCGFQRQDNGPTIQGALEWALSKLYKAPISLAGCSRTDAGVHARGHVSHADVPFRIPLDKLPLALNALLPEGISVLKANQVEFDFHARFQAQGKEYCYRIWNSPMRPAIGRHYMAHVPGKLDLALMKSAADYLIGEHDFTAFSSQTDYPVNPIRRIESIDILRKDDQPIVEISVRGESFLYNMVRIIAGSLVYCGQQKMDVQLIPELLRSPDRKQAGKTMPPQGLTLEKVFYEPDPFI